MSYLKQKALAQKLLDLADIKINGKRPWDIQIKNEDVYSRVFKNGSVGLGEAYMDGWWDAKELDTFFYKLLAAKIDRQMIDNKWLLLQLAKEKVYNFQSKSRARIVGEKHYDLGNDLYKLMLDKRMVYTCAYWKNAKNLEQAQEAKLDLVCRKLGLKKGMKVLDIGFGFGGFAKYAAEKYGVSVTGVTVSKEQLKYAEEECKGLPVKFYLKDYRDIEGMYDRIVSIGMFEAVGTKNFRTFMKVCYDHLVDHGLFLLHTIGNNEKGFPTDPWITKYIFPNGEIPSMAPTAKAFEDLFVVEDWHNFGAYYDKTLLAWFSNFDKGWPKLKDKYGDRFYLMWKYYLLACAGSFRARKNQLWQIVLSKNGVQGVYETVR